MCMKFKNTEEDSLFPFIRLSAPVKIYSCILAILRCIITWYNVIPFTRLILHVWVLHFPYIIFKEIYFPILSCNASPGCLIKVKTIWQTYTWIFQILNSELNFAELNQSACMAQKIIDRRSTSIQHSFKNTFV